MTTLRDQLKAFEEGNYLESDGTMNTRCFVFYDWFCKETSLENKANKLFNMVKRFVKYIEIDLDNTYVFFKNNCPMSGPLYDSFSICSTDDGHEVLYWVTAKSGHSYQAEIVKAPDFDNPLLTANTYTQLFKDMKSL